jgi:hypothetical protein
MLLPSRLGLRMLGIVDLDQLAQVRAAASGPGDLGLAVPARYPLSASPISLRTVSLASQMPRHSQRFSQASAGQNCVVAERKVTLAKVGERCN